jgi:hypothetical protein
MGAWGRFLEVRLNSQRIRARHECTPNPAPHTKASCQLDSVHVPCAWLGPAPGQFRAGQGWPAGQGWRAGQGWPAQMATYFALAGEARYLDKK